MNTNMKVLIADNTEQFGMPCADALHSYGFDVLCAKKDGAALPQLLAEQKPEVLIMDAFMPGLDAIGVLKKLQGEKQLKKPVVIVVSSADSEKIGAQMIAPGAD